MNRHLLIILIIVSVIAGSCTGRKSKADRRDLIPQKDLIEILVRINLANGLLTLPEINYRYRDIDSIPVYNDIIERFGYTREQMDRTMKYYFLRRPKKMIKIYDKVLGRLSEMESRIDEEMPALMAREMNLWTGRSSFSFPDPSGTDTTWIRIPVNGPGQYVLKFTLTIYPDDQSIGPQPGIFFCPADSTCNEPGKYLSDIPYLKDGLPHTYEVILVLKTPVRGTLQGWFIDRKCMADYIGQHSRINGILLTRSLIAQ